MNEVEYATVFKSLEDLCSILGKLPSCYTVEHVTNQKILGVGRNAAIDIGHFSGQIVVARRYHLDTASDSDLKVLPDLSGFRILTEAII
jgi:hypothetical protein